MTSAKVTTWTKTASVRVVPTSNEAPCNDSLAHQYGNNHNSGWLGHITPSWLPYVQLIRLSPPIGIISIYLPYPFGLLHAAILQHTPLPMLIRSNMLILSGSFFLSDAIHIWNILIDAPLDALVERTRNSPIPRGTVSPFEAAVFTATQAVGAAMFLPYLSTSTGQSAIYAIPGIISWIYYPWAKRHIDFPQVVLGFCMGWGFVMGSVAIGKEHFATGVLGSGPNPRAEYSTMCLFFASAVWPMIYDTIYAHQDLKEDVKVGMKSLAVLYRGRTKVLWQLLTLMIALLFASGWLGVM